MRLLKSHGLGNDYLVLMSGEPMSPEVARALCHRHTGPGGDGVLQALPPTGGGHVDLCIWNPDGSIAEKSGNGLRIFARYLVDHLGLPRVLHIGLPGGSCRAEVHADGDVTVAMGRYSIDPAEVPVRRGLVDAELQVEGAVLRCTAVGLGNPHCVVWFEGDTILDELPWRRWGAWLETCELFPNRTNVQFARALSRDTLEARVWERGAGETLASGSSACAVAVAGLLRHASGPRVQVRMPGGNLEVDISAGGAVTLRGPVEEVGIFDLSSLPRRR